MNLRPLLENERIRLEPIEETDFEALFAVASDAKIWADHPRQDRWKQPVFKKYFDEAIESGAAFKVVDKASGKVIGSSRYYNYEEKDNSIMVGYTFYAVKYWGKGINAVVKKLMLDYIFQFVSKVKLFTGVDNIRSQRAIEKLGAEKIAKKEVYYVGEPSRINYLYCLEKEDWLSET